MTISTFTYCPETIAFKSKSVQSFGSGIPTADWLCPCISSLALSTCCCVQQSSRKTDARFLRRGFCVREKRSMHCTTALSVVSAREVAVVRFINVVMAERTVSSLLLDRQDITNGTPPLCRIWSRDSRSILRLHKPPVGFQTLSCFMWMDDNSNCNSYTNQFQTPQSSRCLLSACPGRAQWPGAIAVPPGWRDHRRSWPGLPEFAL